MAATDTTGLPLGTVPAPAPAATPPAPAAPSGATPSMLSDWYSSYMAKPPTTANAAAAQAGTTAWTPGKDATVQGQLTSVLDAGGPLMDRAATRANQQANSRGLLNSSIAVGAGQSALYDAAMPIAQQDANTNAQAGQFNANASNTAALTNANLSTDVSKANAGAANTATAAQNDAGVSSFQQRQQLDSQRTLQGETIAADERKQAADQSFTAAQRGLDRKFTTEERQAMQGYESERLSTQNAFQERLQTLQEGGMDKRQAQQLALQESMSKMAEMGVQNRFDAQQALQSSQFSMEQLAIDRRLVLQHQNELDKLNLGAKLNRQDVPTNYAANLSANTVQAVNAIMADATLTPEAKMGAMQNVVDFANSSMDWAAKFYGTAFPPIAMPAAPTVADPARTPEQIDFERGMTVPGITGRYGPKSPGMPDEEYRP